MVFNRNVLRFGGVAVLGVFATVVALRPVEGQDRKVLAERFKQLDQNQDEILTPDELTQKPIFDRLDLNKDGKIPRAEAREAFENGSLSFLSSLMNVAEGDSSSEAASADDSAATSGSASDGRKAVLLKPSEHGVGRFIGNAAFTSLDDSKHQLTDARQHKATVIAMTSTTCP